MTKQHNQNTIPDFKSVEEEAEWYDAHEVMDYIDEFKPVKVRFAKNLTDDITVRFAPEDMAKLRARADEKGIGPSTLLRMWAKKLLSNPHA
jgi:predicted DNA binding CopG/RHH family protein